MSAWQHGKRRRVQAAPAKHRGAISFADLSQVPAAPIRPLLPAPPAPPALLPSLLAPPRPRPQLPPAGDAGAAAPAAPSVQSALIQAAFAETRTLLDVVRAAVRDAPAAFPDEQLRALLEGAVVAWAPEKLQGLGPQHQRLCAAIGDRTGASAVVARRMSTQAEIIARVLDRLFRTSERPSHVLAAGYQTMRTGSVGGLTGLPGVQSFFPNTIANYLKSRVWRALLATVGDDVMLFLLECTSMFVPTGSGCFVQVCGPPVHESLRAGERLGRGPGRSARAQICSRKQIFYSPDLRQQFASSCPLTKARDSRRGATYLLQSIFHLDSGRPASKRGRLPAKFVAMVDLAQTMVQRFKRCEFRSLLVRACPVAQGQDLCPRTQSLDPAEFATQTFPDTECTPPYTPLLDTQHPSFLPNVEPHNALIQKYCKYSQVSRFLERVLAEVVPTKMWGSKHNFRAVCQSVRCYVRLLRYDRFPVERLLTGFKTKDCSWLRWDQCTSPDEQRQCHAQLTCWLQWVFEHLVAGALRGFFYVTESGAHKQRVFYFRKSVWNKLQNVALDRLQSWRFERLDQAAAQEMLAKGSLGVSHLRLLPKSTGMRHILNMGRKPPPTAVSGGQAASKLSVNQKLTNLFEVLKYEKARQPELLGATVFGYDDVHRQLLEFMGRQKEAAVADDAPSGATQEERFYFVSVDISNCFDSIRQDKLFEVIQQAFQEDEYLIRRFVSLLKVGDKIRKTYRRHVSPAGDLEQFIEFAKGLAGSRDTIFVDQVFYHHEETADLLAMLKDHIYNGIVASNGRFYKQTEGISQGSILSTLLCGFFYGHLERTSLLNFSSGNSLLMRQVDDFLFITDQRKVATSFLRTMHEGIGAYGCEVNTSKTRTSFDPANAVPGEVLREGPGIHRKGGIAATQDCTNSTVQHDQSVWFPWCGLLVNSRTCETRVNYASYVGSFINETLTTHAVSNPGLALKDKMWRAVKQRAHLVLVDPRINSRHGVAVNVFQNFLLCAMKLHAQVRALPPKRRVKSNPGFYNGLVEDITLQLCNYCATRCTKAGTNFSLRPEDVQLLSFSAFLRILERKHTDFTPMLTHLRARRQALLEDQAPGTGEFWQAVMAPHEHTVFAQILY